LKTSGTCIKFLFLSVPLACVICLTASSSLASDAPSDSQPAASIQPNNIDVSELWNSAKTKLKQGAYDEAADLLDQVLAITPNDPWALAYREMCESRLAPSKLIPRLSDEEQEKLKRQIKNEETDRGRGKRSRKQQERDWDQEARHWDEQVTRSKEKALNQDRPRERKVAKRKLTKEPKKSKPVEAIKPSESESSPRPPELVEPIDAQLQPPESSPTPSETLSTADVSEIAPIAGESDLIEEAVIPQLSGDVGKPPGGGVQINARRMSVAPDRNMALAEGDVEVLFEGAVLWCDHMTLFTDTGDVYAQGQVRLQQGKQFFRSDFIHYNFKTKKGRFLQGTISTPPWFQHGRSIETIAEGVYQVTPGYLTSCDLEPPHFRFAGRRSTVFSEDRAAKIRNAAFFVEKVPLFYLPYLSVADRNMPFFIIPGKKKPWGAFVLGGYRYELPSWQGYSQEGTVKLDWRRNFGWGTGLDYQIEHPLDGRGLMKLYFNEEPNRTEIDPKRTLPKGADHNRYRVLWRHQWKPLEDTLVVTDFQKQSDENFRKEFLFRDEYVLDDNNRSFVSIVKNTPDFSLAGLLQKRLHRFESVNEILPQVILDVRQKRIGDTWFFSKSAFQAANLQSKTRHSDVNQHMVRTDWLQEFSYAVSQLQPIELTPRVGMRQSYYTRDRSGSKRDEVVGQFIAGANASLKFFRMFPTTSDFAGLDLNGLRHVLTPTASYSYVHEPTAPNADFEFPAASGAGNSVTLGLENKLQTRRKGQNGKLSSVDLVRFLTELPYSFKSSGNSAGGRYGDWAFKLEAFPWSWMRMESNLTYLSHFPKGLRDSRIPTWNVDLVMLGGHEYNDAAHAPSLVAPMPHGYETGGQSDLSFMPLGQWYLGLGHRYSANDKTEDVLQYDLRLSEKWQLTTFHRFTWKEVKASSKRLHNLREFQYGFKRDLHDWVGHLVYRVDREYGEELFLTFTLKAFPDIPVEMETGYHQPKIGSQSSPFSPVQ